MDKFTDSFRHQGLRKKLVKLLREKGIKDEKVLAAIESFPRHIFFDEAFLEHAYQDKAFPIGEGQTISQPYTVAVQTSLLNIKKGDKVLEIGTGSGYQACILYLMGAKVYSIEYNKNLFNKTRMLINSLNYDIKLFYGDGSKGLPGFAPYDKIVVTAATPGTPSVLLEQLNVNGILVAPVGNEHVQAMKQYIKQADGSYSEKDFGQYKFVPLLGAHGWRN
ncbi:MAG: protein-L-isoaspartate(D-aspartate) O-methyltransferase [Cytophagaceae bacterium]|nr:protein-L-isoaspartate(D-aspartate) O-methyltransferase [Cytophagaceae bacterium]MDW8455384.1 protein-L-isoaspartate(D-aspartate) O-methyltransferase [Cytophagaceae bacterium]